MIFLMFFFGATLFESVELAGRFFFVQKRGDDIYCEGFRKRLAALLLTASFLSRLASLFGRKKEM